MEILIVSIVACAIALWIDYLIAREFYFAAREKGYSGKKYLWICFFLGMVGYLLVIALPNRASAKVEATDELPPL